MLKHLEVSLVVIFPPQQRRGGMDVARFQKKNNPEKKFVYATE